MKTFIGILDKQENSAYGLWFPDLPGCYSAADEKQDVMKNALEAIFLYFEYNDLGAVPVRDAVTIARHAHEDIEAGAVLFPVPYPPV